MIATERAMSAEERAQLAKIFEPVGRGPSRSQLAAINAVVMFVVLMIAFAFAWALLAWLMQRLWAFDLSWQGPEAPWIAVGGAIVCAAFAARASRSWFASQSDGRGGFARDLERGVVVDETYTLTAAKRFKEPEHGGIMYFLRTDDDRVLVLFDYESQNLGVQGGDPLQSAFRPRAKLTIARAPASRVTLSTAFDGAELTAGAPLELATGPEHWPESGELCEVRWDTLERHFGPSKTA